MFEERSAAEVTTLFAAAATASGAGTAVSAGTLHGVDGLADVAGYGKNMLRLMSRRERKSLELEASRFGFEPIDGAGFQAAVLETADRTGLLLAGDVATSVRVACGGTAASPEALAADGRALALLRYALGDAYLTLRRELAEGGD
jgi:anthranilate phosphoribosyltransferase